MTQVEWSRKFRDRLCDALKKNHMNQSQLAKASGLSVSRISDYINMKVVPTIFAVINIAAVLNMNVSDLIDFDDRIRG